VALPAVVFLAVSGIYAASLRVGAWPDLIGTPYGQTLMAKILLAITMVGLGAANLLVMTPRMRWGVPRSEGEAGLVGTFRRLVTSEVVLGSAALLVAGLLTAQVPSRAPAPAKSLTVMGAADDVQVVLDISPGRVGVNTFTVALTMEGSPLVGAKQVELRFASATTDLAGTEATLVEVGEGRYSGRGTYLSMPDRWQVRVAVRREGRFDTFADLVVDLRPADVAVNLPWSRLSGGLLAVAGVLAWLALRPGSSGLPAQILRSLPGAALSLAGVAAFLRPVPAPNLLNPVPPSPASIAAGRALYQQHCQVCHGVSGLGDGPLGLSLNPRPADLTLHTIPGVHSDGKLYDWITNGYAGSVMPAWKERLSDTHRWDLVNFLRTMAPSALP
jgi:mono/diheme cytochrome c family protein